MRVPLHIKLVISYILVVALALLPTAVYLRTSLHREQADRARATLQQDLVTICARLSAGTAGELARRAEAYHSSFPTRVTVVDARGNVVVDSERPGQALPNHGDRPEIRAAIATGVGAAERTSETTGRRMLYVAMRFPPAGPPMGVARLAERMDVIDTGRAGIEAVLRNAGAVALSVAVLLGLVAALVTVRPLRAIASAARAIADGDFGTKLDLRTGDEIEDVASAIDAIVARLRGRLVAMGAEQATTQSVLDEVPVGVILYDAEGRPARVNPAARALCGLEPNVEAARGVEITRLPGQPAAMARARTDARSADARLSLPWRPEATLSARWVRIFADDGADALALIVVDLRAADEAERARTTLADAAAALRCAVATAPAIEDARAWLGLADRCDAAPDAEPPPQDALHPVPLASLVARAREELGPILEGRAVATTGADVQGVVVVEAEDRAHAALRGLLGWLAGRPGPLSLHVSVEPGAVRVSGRAQVGEGDLPLGAAALLRPLGGDAGVVHDEDRAEPWIRLARG